MVRAVGSGGFPERRELSAQLRPIVGEVRSLGANRGYQKFEDLSTLYENESGVYYAPKNAHQKAMETESEYSVAFDQTEIPTSTTDYSRPRTVAAGYDAERQTMTVVFRDGTFYNYYEVTRSEWLAFRASISKGNPWLNRRNKNQGFDGLFLSKPRGVADVNSISPQVRELLYRVARSQQVYKSDKLGKGKQPRAKAIQRQAALKRAYTKRPGRNPSQP